MLNPPKTYYSPLPAHKYGKLTKRSTQQRHQGNESKGGLEAEWVWALGALRSVQSRKKLAAEKRRETHFLSNQENKKWIEDYVERETAVARRRVEVTEATIRQGQDDAEGAENGGFTTGEPEKMFHEMIIPIGDSLSDIASSDHGEDGENEADEQTEQWQLKEVDKPSWEMGAITKTV